MTDVADNDLCTLFICSVRYSLGRQSYMPGLVQDLIVQHAKVLTSDHRKLLAREIMDHYRRFNNIGAEMDTRGWLQFRDWLLSQDVDNQDTTATLSAGGNHE